MSGRANKGREVSADAQAMGHRLRDARVQAGLTVEDVADELGVKPMAVYRWEWGTASFHVLHSKRVAKAYRMGVGWLVAAEKPSARKRKTRKAA